MQPRISMITLGVSDLARGINFYQQGLGLPRLPFPSDEVAFFTLNGSWLGLFGDRALAQDAGVDSAPVAAGSYRGAALAHNLTSPQEVDSLMQRAQQAGATITKPATTTFWGGYSGYFSDPDGHLWELAHNPFMWVGPASHAQQATPVANWQGAVPLQPETITGRFCTLEPLDGDRHCDQLYRAFAGHDQLWDYLPYGPFSNKAAYHDFVSAKALERDPIWYAICVSGKAKGIATYLRIDAPQGSVETGHLCFSPELQRTRNATEAIVLLSHHAFSKGYRRLEWKCDSLNQRSRLAAQRYGFSFEGIFRNASVVKGHNRDTAWYAITCEDWEMLQPLHQQWLDPANFDASGKAKTSLSGLTRPIIRWWG